VQGRFSNYLLLACLGLLYNWDICVSRAYLSSKTGQYVVFLEVKTREYFHLTKELITVVRLLNGRYEEYKKAMPRVIALFNFLSPLDPNVYGILCI
jgi:hypothetical protein